MDRMMDVFVSAVRPSFCEFCKLCQKSFDYILPEKVSGHTLSAADEAHESVVFGEQQAFFSQKSEVLVDIGVSGGGESG